MRAYSVSRQMRRGSYLIPRAGANLSALGWVYIRRATAWHWGNAGVCGCDSACAVAVQPNDIHPVSIKREQVACGIGRWHAVDAPAYLIGCYRLSV